MNLRAIALTCALTSPACGGADATPAQSPASPSSALSSDSSDTVASGASGTEPVAAKPVAAKPNTGKKATGAAAKSTPNSAASTKHTDNTSPNDGGRHGALTAMDQGSSEAETKITASIRKEMMGDETLSFAAKNVKVITIGSKVTLRGSVNSGQEQATIVAFAKHTAGVREVDNQLEVTQ